MGTRFSAPVQTGPGAHPASCIMGTGPLPGVKSGRGVLLTPHHLLVPWSRKGRAIPLFPLWAVRPVRSLSACTRVHFTFTNTSAIFREENASLSWGRKYGQKLSSSARKAKLLSISTQPMSLKLPPYIRIKSAEMGKS